MKPKSSTGEQPLIPYEVQPLPSGGEVVNPRTGLHSPETFSMSQDEDIYRSFVSEAMEHLEAIEITLVNMEQTPEEPEWINALFRSFHTLKGATGFLNLNGIHTLSHAMESLLEAARNHNLRVDREVVDLILEVVDLSKKMVLEVETSIPSGQVSQGRYYLGSILQRIVSLRSRGSIGPDGSTPRSSSGEWEFIQPPLGEILSSKGFVSPGDIQRALEEQAASQGGKKIGEILIMGRKVKPKQVIEALRDQKKIASELDQETIKVDTRKLDHLIDLVGELIIALSRSLQNPLLAASQKQECSRDFDRIRQITADLQGTAMTIRMTPIGHLFRRMIRLVRDLAQKAGKQVELILVGEKTEIDRKMAEALYDSLLHMIRNSIDHGIEPPLRRKEIGKPETGRIFLRAFQRGGYVVIEVEDDGQGLNRQQILKKAQERELIPVGAKLTDYQVDNLIFEPGFSTREQVTDISGRGVGMDVVKKAVEKLGGEGEILSGEGKGCRVVIRIPLTLVMMEGLVVRSGKERFIIPAGFIKENLTPNPDDFCRAPEGGQFLKFRNGRLPLVRLDHFLGIIPPPGEAKIANIIVVENEKVERGLIVDEILGKQQVVMKNLGDKSSSMKGVASATLMGDGGVGFILDIPEILENPQTC